MFVIVLLLVGSVYGQLTAYTSTAADYYVSQSTGSDSNPGTLSAPFQTIAKVMTVSLSTGHCIALKRGDHWREQLTGWANGQCFTSYGNGALPLLDCSDVISSGAFTKTGGFQNIYQAMVTTDSDATSFLRAWENGVGMHQAASLSALDSTPGSYFTAGGPTSWTMYVNASNSSNPATNGYTYEYNHREYGLFSQWSNTTVSGIATQRNYENDGSFVIGPESFATDIIANDGTKHNALMHQGSTFTQILMVNSYYPGMSKVALVLNDGSPTGENAWINNATYIENFDSTGSEGFFGHSNVSGTFGNVYLTNCSTVGAVTGIGGYESNGTMVNGGSYSGPIVLGSTVANLVENVTISAGSVTQGLIQIFAFYTGPTEISHVTLSATDTEGLITVAPGAETTLNIHDSSFTNNSAFSGAIELFDTPSALTVLRNVFFAPVQTNYVQGSGSNALSLSSVIDYNTYHYPSVKSSWWNFGGSSYDVSSSMRWAAWQGLGFDLHSSRMTP